MKLRVLVLLVFVTKISIAQPTWINTFGIVAPPPTAHHDSTSVGPYQLCVTPNGNIISILQVDENHEEILIALDPNGDTLWMRPAGHHGGIYVEESYSLQSTNDNGCIYLMRHMGSYVGDSVYRVGPTGITIWSKYYFNLLGSNESTVTSVTQTKYNTTVIQFFDSLVEVSSTGQFIRNRFPFNYYALIFHLPDSTMLRIDSGLVIKENFNGTQQWSIPATGNEIKLIPNSSFAYIGSDSTVGKIDWTSGNLLWSIPITNSGFSPTSDQGFIIINNNDFSRYDSAGNLLWTKTLPLPEFGLKTLAQTNQNTFITGGAWKMMDLQYYPTYRALLFTIDSIGNGMCDSTDYFYVGNANDNSILSFPDDGVYVAAALGNSGFPRHPTLQSDPVHSYSILRLSTFATDWATGFSAGINHKYCDIDGNGVIDTSDVNGLLNINQLLNYPVIPHWQRQSSTSPEIYFHIPNNHPGPTDTLEVDLILGSSNQVIDSIYGISFNLNLMEGNYFISNNLFHRYMVVPSTALGDTSVNLTSYFNYNINNSVASTSVILCRNDHQNAIVAGDTICKIYFDLNGMQSGHDTINLSVSYNAISEGGFPINLSLITDTAFLSGTTKINETEISLKGIYPNPADQNIKIDFIKKASRRILVYDIAGNEIDKNTVNGLFTELKTGQFPNGVYYLRIIGDNETITEKFIINH